MSVLETFYFAFKSDSKDVKKGAEDAKKSANELETGILSTKEAAEALGQSFIGAIASAQRNVVGLLSIGALTAKTLREAAESENLALFSERLGHNIEQVDAWSRANAQAGGSAGAFRGTLESLTQTLTEFTITGGGAAAETFARLGINAFNAGGQLKDAFELLPEIADAFQEISDTEAANLGQKLGLDNATILLLQRGRGEIDALTRRQQQLGLTTKEDTELAVAFNQAWRDTQTLFGSVARQIGSVFLPVFTELQTQGQNLIIFLRENEQFMKEVFLAAAGVITAVYLPAMTKAAIATGLALAPFLLLAFGVAAIALAINDLNNYLAGNDSIIGRLAERWPLVGEVIKSVAKVFENLKTVFSELFDTIKEQFKGGASKQLNRFLSFIGLKDDEQPEEADNIGGTHGRDDIPAALRAAQDNPLATISPDTIRNQSNNQNHKTSVSVENINVDARGGNSEEIASKLAPELTGQMEQAIAQSSTAIAG